MSVTHIVSFGFKEGTPEEVIKNTCAGLLALKNNCIHPTSNQPYILSVAGGKDNSPEGNQNGITHAFVMQFASAEDRDYYAFTDPVHQEFVRGIIPYAAKVQVNDFTDGVF